MCTLLIILFFLFFFYYTPTTVIYTLSLHDALPISAKDISNVVTDAASGVVDIFHGIDKAVADTWNNINHTRSSIRDRKSGSAGMPRPISYAVFCLKKKKNKQSTTNKEQTNLTYSQP